MTNFQSIFKYIIVISATMSVALFPGASFAAIGINKQIPYQGVLKTASGVKATDGNYDMVFKIYDAASLGTTLWTGTHTAANGNAVAVTDGVFSVLLGSGTGNAMTIDFNNDTLYLGVKIGSDSEMMPRKRVGSSPYAFNADLLDGVDSLSFLRSDQAGTINAGLTVNGSITLASITPATTTNAIYNQAGALYWNGTILGGVSGIASLNGLTSQIQTFAVGTAGADFTITSSGSTHIFNLPTASSTARGILSSADWSIFNNKENAIIASTTATYFRGDKTFRTLDTSVVPENGNAYYTQARFDSAFAAKSTSNLAEGANLYYTDARARSALSVSTPLSYSASTGAFSIALASAASDGVMSTTTQTFAGAKTFSGDVTMGNKLILNTTIEGAGLADCLTPTSKVQYNGTTKQFLCDDDDLPDTATFVDTVFSNPTSFGSENVEIFDAYANRANITPTRASSTVMVAITARMVSDDAADEDQEIKIVRAIGINPVCASDTEVGRVRNHANTITGQYQGASGVFLDSPATIMDVRYTACTGTPSPATGIGDTNLTEIRLVLVVLGADIAENYYTTDDSLGPGDIVAIDEALPAGVKKAAHEDRGIVGVISTAPAHILDDHIGRETGKPVPVALTGRTPVKVTNEDGFIQIGDKISLSRSIPGYGKRASLGEQTIGISLSSFGNANSSSTETGYVLMFVSNQDGLDQQMAGNTKFVSYLASAIKDIISLGDKLREALVAWFADAANGIGDFFANRVRTKELCVGDDAGAETCITKSQLDALLEGQIIAPAPAEQHPYKLAVPRSELRSTTGENVGMLSEKNINFVDTAINTTDEIAPTESAPAEVVPEETAPAEIMPVESMPVEVLPIEPASIIEPVAAEPSVETIEPPAEEPSE